MAVSLSRMVLALSNPLLQARRQPDYIQKQNPSDLETRIKLSATRPLRPARAISMDSLASSSTATGLQQELGSEAKTDSQDTRTIADSWRQLQGENNWDGLLDPMDPLLRHELLKYGSKVQACYDSFEFDPTSKYFGSSRYSKRELYKTLGMAEIGYDITRYLYVTSNVKLPKFFLKTRFPRVWSTDASWMGYITVSNDKMTKKLGRRDVCIVWRGTITRLEWIADLSNYLKPLSSEIPCPDPLVRVEAGFLTIYTDAKKNCQYCNISVREQVLAEIYKLVNETYPDEELSITIVGHSLGSALALLTAYDVAETVITRRKNDNRKIPVTAFTFAGPRVGNNRFKQRVEQLGVKVLRIVNVHDIVPDSPGFLFNENTPPAIMNVVEHFPWGVYTHLGVELELDHKNSPFLRPDGDVACAHNLEGYLHVLNGYHGKGKKFEPAMDRDPALVNKSSDFLKDELEVMINWMQNHNKGMVLKNGRYVQIERSMEDHITENNHHHIQQIRTHGP
ncbi:phospholipase A1-Igamma2, chloroplastic-like [Primulina tabacum]|uniref:phospholipase A1-Igamma2, chloroplastic-like n=1 Tax=Primulina tabacum TaxID=48773 RepID=UPI003F590BFA